ncbi:MAG TPA: hypothetical protein VF720_11520, partial [Candidatus Eisenbacteria bacterium]
MGPSILDAVYRATAAAGAGNDSLFIIFSEDLNPGDPPVAADFNFNGGLASGDVGGLSGGSVARVGRNLVVMSNFTTPYANGDSVQVSVSGALTGADGSVQTDVSLIAIRTGPAIYRAEIIPNAYDSRPNGDVLRLYFTHEIASGLSLTDPRQDFVMAEFGTGAANLTAALVGTKAVDITFGNQEGASSASHGKMLAQISKIRLIAGAIAGDFNGSGDGADENSTTAPFHTVDSIVDAAGGTYRGPYLLAAGYNSKATGPFTDDVLTLVFSDDVDPSSVTPADFVLGGATFTQVTSNDGDHIIELRDLSAAPASVSIVAGVITDYQGFVNPTIAASVVASPIIVHTRYQDGGDSDPNTDIVEIYFDTPVIGSFADTTDFDYYGFVSNGLIVTDNTDNDSLIALTGFTVSNNWEPGDRIGLRPGTNMTAGGPPTLPTGNGAVATNVGADATRPIRDFSAPRQLHFVLNQTYFRDAQSIGGADTAYYAFNEVDVDDSAYFLLFTRRNSPVDEIYIQTYLNNARFIANPNPGYQAAGDLNRNLIGTYDISPGLGTYSDGQTIQLGDNVNLGICAVDADGNIALNTTSCLFVGALVAGPVPPPRDHDCVCFAPAPGQLDAKGVAGQTGAAFADGCNPVAGQTTDTDMIHIIGDRNPDEHFIFGDAGSAIGADSIRVYDDAALTVLLGSGPANPVTGTFAVFSIGQPTDDFVWVVAVDVVAGNSTLSSPTPIRNDLPIYDAVYASTFRDPLNSLRRYSPGDTVRVLGAVTDTAGTPDVAYFPPGIHKSDLLAISADFRGFSTRAGSDSVVFISLGANQNDEDNDWIDNGSTRFDNTVIAFNNVKDYPEPYVDENGDGVYNCGETFVDYSAAGYTAKIYDIGDQNLDSSDPEEHGWYYVEYWIDPNDATLVADPDGGDNFATLNDVNIPVRILDNAITSQNALNQLSDDIDATLNDRTLMSFTTDLSLDHLTNTALDSAFVATLDALAPTVSEISYLEKQTSLDEASSYPAGNIITPGDHAYELPSGMATPYINFVDSTLSDDDVIFVAVQIDDSPNSSSEPDAGWKYLSLDPSGDKADVGYPGIRNIDDDYDTTGVFGVNVKTNGLDDDEDGVVDEDGEG